MSPNEKLDAVEAVVVSEHAKRPAGFAASLFDTTAILGASAVDATGMFDFNATGFTGTTSSAGFMATVLSFGTACGCTVNSDGALDEAGAKGCARVMLDFVSSVWVGKRLFWATEGLVAAVGVEATTGWVILKSGVAMI